jgi:phosphoserine phosphatase
MTDSWDDAEENAGRGATPAENVPLVVDLDGSLLRTDLLLESALLLINQRPWLVFWMPLWLLRGRAYLKRRIFQRVHLDVSLLPANEDLLAWLREEKARGRRLVLATASDYYQACLVVAPLALFDTVLGSDGQRNLKGREKLKTIVELCGERFDYVGNSSADLTIWRNCRHAIVVNASTRIERSARRVGTVVRVFPPSLTPLRDMLRLMRLEQWYKNLLIFVPAIISQTILDEPVWSNATLAFLSFGFAASAAYILNDLLDLEADRRHATNRHRSLASGRTFIGSGILLGLACLSASLALAIWLPTAFSLALIAYLFLASMYSLLLQRLFVIDVLALALLYTLRIIAGHLATGVPLSVRSVSVGFLLLLCCSAWRSANKPQYQRWLGSRG